MFKDVIGFLASEAKIEGRKFEIMMCQVDLPANTSIIKQYGLKKFPVLAAINSKGKLLKVLVGASIQYAHLMVAYK